MCIRDSNRAPNNPLSIAQITPEDLVDGVDTDEIAIGSNIFDQTVILLNIANGELVEGQALLLQDYVPGSGLPNPNIAGVYRVFSVETTRIGVAEQTAIYTVFKVDGSDEPANANPGSGASINLFIENIELGFAILGTNNTFHGDNTFIGKTVFRDTDDDIELQGPNPTLTFVADIQPGPDSDQTPARIDFYEGSSLDDPAVTFRARIEADTDEHINIYAGGDSDNLAAQIFADGHISVGRQTVTGDNDDVLATKGYVDAEITVVEGAQIGLQTGRGIEAEMVVVDTDVLINLSAGIDTEAGLMFSGTDTDALIQVDTEFIRNLVLTE